MLIGSGKTVKNSLMTYPRRYLGNTLSDVTNMVHLTNRYCSFAVSPLAETHKLEGHQDKLRPAYLLTAEMITRQFDVISYPAPPPHRFMGGSVGVVAVCLRKEIGYFGD